MFGKEFNKEDKDAEITTAKEPEVKSFSQDLPVEVPKPATAVDANSFMEKVKENPENSATLENCDSKTYNKVYLYLNELKLQNGLKWDGNNKILKYK